MRNKRRVKINGGGKGVGGGVGGLEIFDKFNKQGVGGGVVGISKYLLISVMNEKRDTNV